MARRHSRPPAQVHGHLQPLCPNCWVCGRRLWKVDTHSRTVATLAGLVHYTLAIRACPNPVCDRYRRPYHPEAEGLLALPHGEFGLDVLAFVGAQRYQEHRSVPEIHQGLRERGVTIAFSHRHRVAAPLRRTRHRAPDRSRQAAGALGQPESRRAGAGRPAAGCGA